MDILSIEQDFERWYYMDKKNIGDNKKIINLPKRVNRMNTVKVTTINATPTIEGKYAQEIILEVLRKPSEEAILRNKKAQALVKKLRK